MKALTFIFLCFSVPALGGPIFPIYGDWPPQTLRFHCARWLEPAAVGVNSLDPWAHAALTKLVNATIDGDPIDGDKSLLQAPESDHKLAAFHILQVGDVLEIRYTGVPHLSIKTRPGSDFYYWNQSDQGYRSDFSLLQSVSEFLSVSLNIAKTGEYWLSLEASNHEALNYMRSRLSDYFLKKVSPELSSKSNFWSKPKIVFKEREVGSHLALDIRVTRLDSSGEMGVHSQILKFLVNDQFGIAEHMYARDAEILLLGAVPVQSTF